jgi:hypothetical protein
MEEARCHLRLEIKPLQESHLLPKSLFRLLRVQNAKNPDPVMFTRKAAWTTSTQFANRLLCFDCEQLFHKNGEDWVLRHCYRGNGRFRLREMITGTQPLSLNVSGLPFSPSQVSFIPTRLVPGMDIQKLAYFAASVIWRAGVHKWVVDEHELKPIDIREDQLEELRRFLLGETAFPSDTYLWVSISDNESPLTGMVFAPYGGFENAPTPHYSFRFLIPGTMFALFMGCFVPPIVPPLCSLRSPDRVLHLTANIENVAFQYAMEFMKTTRPSESVRAIHQDEAQTESS